MCCLLTGQNFECEGVLLLDGVCEEEASVAAVVSVSIFGQNVGEVQVSIQTHGHSLILRDWSHSCRRTEGRKWKRVRGNEITLTHLICTVANRNYSIRSCY